MKKIVLAGACRTAIGKFGGALSNVPVGDLGAVVVKEAIKRSGIKPEDIDEVMLGCVLQAAEGQNVSRQAAIRAGLPVEVPALTINNVCGSSLKAVNMAAGLIQSDQGDVFVVGGMETMSAAAYAMPKARFGYRMGNGALVDTMVNDALWDVFNDYHMGITAENICEQWKLTREELDTFAASSQNKAEQAQKEGKFKDEIVPVPIKIKREQVLFAEDEGIRPGVTAKSISTLRPAFKKDGIVTAANSSTINDGAAAIVVMSEEKAKELGVTPMAEWVTGASAGVPPEIMGIGPVASSKKALAQAGLTIADMDLIEANEAFAAQAVAVGKDLGIKNEQLNVNGGAISLGHPVGASGCRILVTLLYEMQRRKSAYGLATLCVGGGMGVTAIVKHRE